MSVSVNPSVYIPNVTQTLGAQISSDKAPQASVVTDPHLLAMQMAEEAGFMVHGTKRTTESVDDEKRQKLEDANEASAKRALNYIAEQVRAIEFEQDTKAIADYIVQVKSFIADKAFIEELFAPYSKGSSAYNLALLNALIARGDIRLEAQGVTAEFAAEYAEYRSREITAFVNVAEALGRHTNALSMSSKELMGAYESAIVHTDCVLTAWSELGRRFGLENCESWKSFLQDSVVADLYAQDIGADKTHLQHILKELKGFRILQTLQGALQQLKQNRLPNADVTEGQLVQTTLDLSREPVSNMPEVEQWVFAQSMDEQILFLQGYRQVCSSLPVEAYPSQERAQEVISVIQDSIDARVWQT